MTQTHPGKKRYGCHPCVLHKFATVHGRINIIYNYNEPCNKHLHKIWTQTLRPSSNCIVLAATMVLCSSMMLGSRSFHMNVSVLDCISAEERLVFSMRNTSVVFARTSFFSRAYIVSASTFSTNAFSSIISFVLAGVFNAFCAISSYSSHNLRKTADTGLLCVHSLVWHIIQPINASSKHHLVQSNVSVGL